MFVVAYGTMGGAERLWWLLRHFGHDDCAVLAGGSTRGAGRSRRGEEQIEPAAFVPRVRTDDASTAEELAERLGDRVVARGRAAAEPLARRAEPGRRPAGPDPRRAERTVGEPLPELPEGELVAYCGSGVTACVVLHRASLHGREGRLYPGSWSEWRARPAARARG